MIYTSLCTVKVHSNHVNKHLDCFRSFTTLRSIDNQTVQPATEVMEIVEFNFVNMTLYSLL